MSGIWFSIPYCLKSHGAVGEIAKIGAVGQLMDIKCVLGAVGEIAKISNNFVKKIAWASTQPKMCVQES